jgi:5-methyltetrahydrofolate--homocysteine methyltransferase
MENLESLYTAVLDGDAKSSALLTRGALAAGADPMSLVTGAMIPAMDEAGKRFEEEEYFVPELLLAARAMKAAMELIRPLLVASGAKSAGRIAVGTVKGDLHDIGKNLVASMLEGGGFDVIDLGADVSPERFIKAINEQGAQVVCLSALLTVTMPAMKTTIEAFKTAGVRDRIKVLVGGAPVSEQYAKDIGADGFGENANSAVSLVRRMLSGGN